MSISVRDSIHVLRANIVRVTKALDWLTETEQEVVEAVGPSEEKKVEQRQDPGELSCNYCARIC